jgi:hypothetical protein
MHANDPSVPMPRCGADVEDQRVDRFRRSVRSRLGRVILEADGLVVAEAMSGAGAS